MSDWIGIVFIILSIVGVILGLKYLAKPRKTSPEDFERNVTDGISTPGASMNALNEMMNPEAARGMEFQKELKKGSFSKKKQEGKTSGNKKSGWRRNDDKILDAEIIE